MIVFAKATVVDDDTRKMKALEAFTEHVIPGRWSDVRRPTELELKATTVLSLPIDEASAKVRTGGPVDDEKDYELGVWAGVIPLVLTAGDAVADERLDRGIETPSYALTYKR